MLPATDWSGHTRSIAHLALMALLLAPALAPAQDWRPVRGITPPPTETETATPTEAATATYTISPTSTPTEPDATFTPTPSASLTPTEIATATSMPSMTWTPSPTPTQGVDTATVTATPIVTETPTASETPTEVSSRTRTPKVEPTDTPTQEEAPTETPTETPVQTVNCQIIEGPAVSRTSSTAMITWTTNLPSTGSVSSIGLESFPTASDSNQNTDHTVQLSQLEADTVYDYALDADCSVVPPERALPGRARRIGSFTTRDLGAPQIEGPEVPVSGMSSSSAIVLWKTNIPANSFVRYGLTQAHGQIANSVQMRQDHSLELQGLTAGQTYHFQVESCDAFGNCTESEDQTFDFVVPPGDGLLSILSQTAIGPDNVSHNQAFVEWTTDEPATSVVQYGLTNALGQETSLSGLSLEHRVVLSNLDPGTNFCHHVLSRDLELNEATSGVSCFTMDSQPDSTPPELVELEATRGGAMPEVTYITDDGFVLEWQTNEPASAELFADPFNSARGVGGEAWISSGVRKRFSASVRLRNRGRGTDDYRYKLRLTDLEGNRAQFESPIGTFIRLVEDTTPPVLNGDVEVNLSRANRITLEWTTDEAADTRVRIESNGQPLPGYRWRDPQPSRKHRIVLTRLDDLPQPFSVVIQSCNLEGLCMQPRVVPVLPGQLVGSMTRHGASVLLLGLTLVASGILLRPRRVQVRAR